MTEFDSNSLDDRVQVYDAFAQLVSGSDKYKLLSLQEVNPEFVWPMLDRISTDGELFLTPEISQHIHTQRLVLTADEVDTVHPPTNTRTVSFFIYQKNLRNNVEIEISIVYNAKDAASNKILRLDYTYEIIGLGVPRVNGDGDVFLDFRGRILPDSITFVRSSS